VREWLDNHNTGRVDWAWTANGIASIKSRFDSMYFDFVRFRNKEILPV